MTDPTPAAKPIVTFDDFAKLDLRIATVTRAEHHPSADRLLKLQVDDGSGSPRQICAGIREHYGDPSSLIGRQIVIVANLAPRTIRGEESRGMLLAASNLPKDPSNPGADRSLALLTPDKPMPPGAFVS